MLISFTNQYLFKRVNMSRQTHVNSSWMVKNGTRRTRVATRWYNSIKRRTEKYGQRKCTTYANQDLLHLVPLSWQIYKNKSDLLPRQYFHSSHLHVLKLYDTIMLKKGCKNYCKSLKPLIHPFDPRVFIWNARYKFQIYNKRSLRCNRQL